jgi:glyoxylase-like metal-dependent hydrolase (beta-lactamase superfamily II)
MSTMILSTHAAPPFFKNAYLIAGGRTREAVIIDPGDEVEEVIRTVRHEAMTVRYILLTHAHLDHVTGVGRAKAEFGVPVLLHRDDLPLYERLEQQGLMFGLRVEPQPPVDRFYEEREVIRVGDLEIRPHHTPGHCPGGVCLQVGSPGGDGLDLFVGDTLFSGSIGRTDLPGGDHATLIRSIRNVLFSFGDEARVYPGHGEATTIGRERRTNPFLQPGARA